MDPRNRADQALARARARGAFVVTPDNATSPMDSATTVRIPRSVVNGADQSQATNPDIRGHRTPVEPQERSAPESAGNRATSRLEDATQFWPPADAAEAPAPEYRPAPSPQMPPNPYEPQRAPGEFGPLGSRAAQQQPQFPPH